MYKLTISHLERSRDKLVPVIFTNRQYEILKKKLSHGNLTNVERVYMSSVIKKKLNAILSLAGLSEDKVFVYNKADILKQRLDEGIRIVKRLSRKFNNKKILISGGFLFKEKYNDIDVFIFSKYDKEDYRKRNLHINYLPHEAVDSIFFKSISQICISNFPVDYFEIKEVVTIERIISEYQELFHDIKSSRHALKDTLRNFIVDCVYISDDVVLNPKQLDHQVNKILKHKNIKVLLRKIFVKTVIEAYQPKKIKKVVGNLRESYDDLVKEYGMNDIYSNLIKSCDEVLESAS